MEARIIVNGIEEVNVYGEDREYVLSQAAFYFSQYAQDFNETIELKVTSDPVDRMKGKL